MNGTLASRQIVGSVGHPKVRLDEHREVAVEVQADREDVRALSPGAPVTLGVDPASVILIHA
ncbi:TOBE domain-containing protein [Celeribacter halophilus]|uniref:TOBE domain-containing protein n=1 Tax=Celeribacter halophilus TaxID=576117 RepID=A0A1I3NNP3_9RHOB|nr:TOBE domain-containing protein [Celeribacter halophilus]PZX14579.1 TOBE domain-containing protein [Celeribacter halophilus]SFJ10777.1 TOBE domain-containing protein [Celeribacter halophilus]